MDYSVGSIAELISGKSSSNKQKVIQQKVTHVVPANPEKTKKIKHAKAKLNKSVTLQENKPIKPKKRSRSTGDLDEQPAKKKKKPERSNNTNSPPQQAKQKTQSKTKNAERRVKDKIKAHSEEIVKDRTIFVGNVPISVPKQKLKKLFMKYGHVDSLRLRGVPVADPRVPKKVAFIKKEFHPDRNSLHCYVRYATPEEAEKALALNGYVYHDHHLRVMMAGEKVKPDGNKSIFIGNVSFNAEEEELWQLFEPCGKISSVRLIRDAITGIGKGFGYINFEDSDAVELALQMESPTLKGRVLRVSVCNANMDKKKKNRKVFMNQLKGSSKKQSGTEGAENVGRMKSLTVRKMVPDDKSATLTKKKKKRHSSETEESTQNEGQQSKSNASVKSSEFGGIQFTDKKKKKKVNKGLLQKKKLIKKFMPKSNNAFK